MEENISEESLTTLLLKKEKELQNLAKIRINQLQEELKHKDRLNQELEAQLVKIQEDFNYNLQIIEERDHEIADLDAAYKSLNQALYEKENTQNESRSQDHLYKAQEEAKNNDYEKIIQELSNQLDEITSQINELKFEAESKSNQCEELKGILQNKQNKYKRQINQMKYTLTEQDLRIEDYEKKMNENQNSHVKQITDLSYKIMSLENDKQDLINELKKARERNIEEIQYIGQLKISSYEHLDTVHRSEIERFNLEISGLNDENKKLSYNLEQARLLLVEKETNFKSEIQELKSFYGPVTKEIDDLRSALKSKENELDKLKHHIEYWKKLANNRNDEIVSAKRAQIATDDKLKILEKDINELNFIQNNQIQNSEYQRKIDHEIFSDFSETENHYLKRQHSNPVIIKREYSPQKNQYTSPIYTRHELEQKPRTQAEKSDKKRSFDDDFDRIQRHIANLTSNISNLKCKNKTKSHFDNIGEKKHLRNQIYMKSSK